MLTNSYNIKAKRGDTFVSPIFQIILNDVVFDLSDVEIKITLKKSPSQEIPILIFEENSEDGVYVDACTEEGYEAYRQNTTSCPIGETSSIGEA